MRIRTVVVFTIALFLSLGLATGCSDDGASEQADPGLSDAGGDVPLNDSGSADANKDAEEINDAADPDADDPSDTDDTGADDAADVGPDATDDGGLDGGDGGGDGGDVGDAGDVEEDTGPPPVDDIDPTGGWWSDDYSMPGLQGASGARGYVLEPDPNSDGIYVAGDFEVAGMTAAEGIAFWDGTQWTTVGSTPPSIQINALATDTSGTLYAGGAAGGGFIGGSNSLETWDGSQWQTLARIGGGDVSTIEVLSDGRVIVGGNFTDVDSTTAENLAVYDGQSWSVLGSAQPDATVRAIEEMSDGRICIGGDFGQVGSVSASRIACYDGTDWQALGAGMNSGVYTLLEDHNGDLLAGGTFSISNGQGSSDTGLGRWDGNKWSGISGGVVLGSVTSVRALAHGPSNALYVGGTFAGAGKGANQIPASMIVRLNSDGSWSGLGSGVYNTVGIVGAGATGVNDLWVDEDNGRLITTGLFSHAGDTFALNIAQWTLGATDNTGWSTMVSSAGEFMGADRLVSVLTTAPNGDVYAGGQFSMIGGSVASRAAVWNQSGWNALGDGLDGQVHDIVVDSSNNVYFGGGFDYAGSQLISHFAMWNGTSWVDPNPGPLGVVRALAIDATDTVYIAAEDNPAGNNAHTVYAWNGQTLQKLGESFAASVNTLQVGPGGDLYAGGHFREDLQGNKLHRLARFDGTKWVEHGGGIGDGYVTSMDIYDGKLLVAGRFDEVDGQPAGSVALWDASGWNLLSGGLPPRWQGGSPPSVAAVAAKANGFFVTGTMRSINSLDVNYIAWYDGRNWHALGVGMSDLGEAMAISNYRLFVGGPFTVAGDFPSYHIAEWNYVP